MFKNVYIKISSQKILVVHMLIVISKKAVTVLIHFVLQSTSQPSISMEESYLKLWII